MAYIKVDHSKFSVASKSIKNYISKTKKNMSAANNDMAQLRAGFEGKDYDVFNDRWQQVDGKDSVYNKMIKSLDNYADFLDFAADKYKKAQTNAVNRANALLRY